MKKICYLLAASGMLILLAGCQQEVVQTAQTYNYLNREGSGLMTQGELTAIGQSGYDAVFSVSTYSMCVPIYVEGGTYSEPSHAHIIGRINDSVITDSAFMVSGYPGKATTPQNNISRIDPSQQFDAGTPAFSAFEGGDSLFLGVWGGNISLYHPKPFILPRAPMEWNAGEDDYEEYVDRDHFTFYWNADEKNPLGVLITITADEHRSDIHRPVRRFIVPDNGQFTLPVADLAAFPRNERISIDLTRGNYRVATLADGKKVLFYAEQSLYSIETMLR